MAFIKTILIILLVYFLLKILARWFAPKILNYAARKTEMHFKKKFSEFQQGHSGREKQMGDVIIKEKPSKNSTTSENLGEYIDFEEIE